MSTRGLVYAPRTEGGPLLAAGPGEVVAHAERRPPWIVVDHAIASVVVASWPGRLLAVEVTDPVGDADLAAVGQVALRAGAGYTRAIAVRVLEELPAWGLFGAHGQAVAEVIEAAQRLTLASARALADAVTRAARRAYAEAWDAWLAAEGRADSIHAGGDHAGTLAIPARSRARSPIGCGFSVIASELRRRALVVTEGAAVVVDAEGESSLVAPWRDATEALLYAAMARGAPALLSERARGALLQSWDTVRPALPDGR